MQNTLGYSRHRHRLRHRLFCAAAVLLLVVVLLVVVVGGLLCSARVEQRASAS